MINRCDLCSLQSEPGPRRKPRSAQRWETGQKGSS